ncbi:MAG: hypothetical protein IPK67_19630 [Planctomycetes bacterium]|nr:hypothetical protein [Planctomycetota bacterium]
MTPDRRDERRGAQPVRHRRGPENVKAAAVASVNNFVTYHVQAIDEAKGLVTQAPGGRRPGSGPGPDDLAKEVASNPMDIPKVAKTITNNIRP